MKKYTKKIMAMVTVAATMVTGTAIPVMADDAPTIRLILQKRQQKIQLLLMPLLCLAVQEIPQTSHVQAVIWDI